MASPRIRYVNTASTGGGDGTTNNTSGSTRAYASLNAALTAEAADLVAADVYLVIYCCGATADTLQGWVTGFTVDATRYVRIEGNPWHANGRHRGVWSTSHYRLSMSEAFNHAVLVEQPYTQLVGLQIENTAGNADNSLRLNTGVAGDSGNDDCLCDSLIVRIGTTTYGGTAAVQASGKARWLNCLFYGGSNGSSGFYAVYTGPGRADADLYHCVAANNAGPGFSSSSASNDVNLTNCYAGGNGGDDFVGGGMLASITNCRSEDGTSGGAAVAFSTSAGAYFTNVTPGSEDFHIGASSALRGIGAVLSGLALIDIDRQGRIAWDVGADAYTVGPSVEVFAAPALADFTSAGGNQDFTIDGGGGANRVMYVYLWMRTDRGHSIAITYNGVSLSAVGASAQNTDEGTTTAQLYRLIAPATNLNTLRFAIGTGSGNGYANAHVIVVQDVDQGTPNDTAVHEAESGAGASTTQDVSVSSAVGDLVLTFAQFSAGGGNDTTGSVSSGSYTLLQQNQHGGTFSRVISGHAAGAATVTPATSYNNLGAWGATRLAVSINPVAGGTGGELTWVPQQQVAAGRAGRMVASGMTPPGRVA